MYNPLSKDFLLLLSKHLVLPWVKKHKCKQQFGFLSAESIAILSGSSSSNYCSFCEEYNLWFTFTKDILIYISPKQEIEIAEINFHHLLESINANYALQSNNLKKRDGNGKRTVPGAGVDVEISNPNEMTPKKAESKTDPDMGIWVTSCGVYYFKLSQLQVHLQLLHAMLKELFRVPDVDAFYNLLVCLKMLIIHDDCLETANKDQKGFLIYCLEKLLVPR